MVYIDVDNCDVTPSNREFLPQGVGNIAILYPKVSGMRYPKQSGIFLAVTPGNRENPLSVFTY